MNFKISNPKSPIHLPQRKINLSCPTYLMSTLATISNFPILKKGIPLFSFLLITLLGIQRVGYTQDQAQASNTSLYQSSLPILQAQTKNTLQNQKQDFPQLQGPHLFPKLIPFTQKTINNLTAEDLSIHAKLLTASQALETGLPGLAQTLYEEILRSDASLSKKEHDKVIIQLTTALISQRQYTQARLVLQKAYDATAAAYKLRLAILELVDRNTYHAENELRDLDVEKLNPMDRSWYYLSQGLVAELRSNSQEAARYLRQAKDLAVSEAQKAEIEALIYRNQILSTQVSEALLPILEKRLNSAAYSKAYAKYALEYAVVLDELGQNQEAIDFLKTQLQDRTRLGKEEMAQYWTLLAILSKGGGDLSQKALQFLVKNDANIQNQRIVLYLLARSSDKTKPPLAFRQYLENLAEDVKSKQILGDLLILKATLSLELQDYDAAHKDATQLLQEFPGEAGLEDQATGFLAYISLSRQPPQYRIAANYISSLESKTKDPTLKTDLLILAADCYFLNEDYSNAASFYDSALKMGKFDSSEKRGTIFYQLVLSEIYAERLDEAEAIVQNIEYLNNVGADYYWKSQWNLVYAEKQKGQLLKAYERVKQFLSRASAYMPEELLLRFIWLEAQLTLDLKRYLDTQQFCQQIIATVQGPQSISIDPDFKKEMLAYTYYLEGQSYLAEGKLEDALRVLAILRQNYPNYKPAILSYIIEARYYSSKGRAVEAQQKLVELADKYAHDDNVPIALYEAAIQADRRGVSSSYKEAISLLERLCINFPNNPLVYPARLKQGDILRKMNDFASAQLVYENLINSYKDNPNKPLAMIGRAECLLAEGSSNPLRYEEAAIAFERIFDMTQVPIDLRIEAGYKWAYALEMQQDFSQARQTYWQNISQFLLDPTFANQLGATGRYWMSKTIFSLGALFEKNQNNLTEARSVYQLILTHNLPGQTTAKTKL